MANVLLLKFIVDIYCNTVVSPIIYHNRDVNKLVLLIMSSLLTRNAQLLFCCAISINVIICACDTWTFVIINSIYLLYKGMSISHIVAVPYMRTQIVMGVCERKKIRINNAKGTALIKENINQK